MLEIPKGGWIQKPIFFRGKVLRYMDVSVGGFQTIKLILNKVEREGGVGYFLEHSFPV